MKSAWWDRAAILAAASIAVGACAGMQAGSVFGSSGECSGGTRSSSPLAYCEDFTGAQQGSLPAGWTGNAIVGPADPNSMAAGKPMLQPARAEPVEVTIPWKLGGDFHIGGMGKLCRSLAIRVGDVSIYWQQSGAVDLMGLRSKADGTLHDTSAPWSQQGDQHGFTFERRGDEFVAQLDRQYTVSARYAGAPDADSMRISAGPGCAFAVQWLRAEAPRGPTPAIASSAANAPASATATSIATASAPPPAAPFASAPAVPAASASAPVPATPTASVEVVNEMDSGNPLDFTFVVDGKEVAGTFRVAAPQGSKATFTVPAGRLLWAAFAKPSNRQPCQGGGDPIKDVDLKSSWCTAHTTAARGAGRCARHLARSRRRENATA